MISHPKERKIMEVRAPNWQKACFVPTRSVAFVVGFRRWMIKYAGGQIKWGGKFSAMPLAPTPPRETADGQVTKRLRNFIEELEITLRK
ncbi:hypothetical protein ACOSQ4_017226 [Xanthoceras sorbifolium]